MENLQLTHVPKSKTGMLIRKPVAEVFEAFVDPDITTKFWFTKSSGRLESRQAGSMGLGNVRRLDPGDGKSHRSRTSASSSSGRDTAVPPPWNGYSRPKRMAQRSSASRRPASLATAMNWSNRLPTRLKGLLWCSRASKHSLSITSD